MFTCSANPVPRANTCNDPARERLEELWHIHGTWHESIFQLLSMRNVGTTLHDISQEYVDVKKHALRSSACPYGQGSKEELTNYRVKAEGQAPLCPSHDMINYDENRIPSTLFEKRCSCSGCGFIGGSSERTGQHAGGVNTLGCKPVTYHVKVLRRVNCTDNVFIYRPVLEPLVVGCTCEHLARQTAETKPGVIRPVPAVQKEGRKKKRNRLHTPVQK